MLGGDPDPVISSPRPILQGPRLLPHHPLSTLTLAGVCGWASAAARRVPGAVGEATTPEPTKRGLTVATLVGVKDGASLAAVPEAGDKGKPPASPYAESVPVLAIAIQSHRAAGWRRGTPTAAPFEPGHRPPCMTEAEGGAWYQGKPLPRTGRRLEARPRLPGDGGASRGKGSRAPSPPAEAAGAPLHFRAGFCQGPGEAGRPRFGCLGRRLRVQQGSLR